MEDRPHPPTSHISEILEGVPPSPGCQSNSFQHFPRLSKHQTTLSWVSVRSFITPEVWLGQLFPAESRFSPWCTSHWFTTSL